MSGAEDLAARLAAGATSLARCWQVTRADGESFGFTDHDGDLDFGGVTFRAASGWTAGALETATGLSVDNASALGALSSDVITEADILAGKWDGAEVSLWFADWADPEVRVLKFRGSLGEIQAADGSFEAELRGLEAPLNRPVGRAYQVSCDAALGDSRCGVALGSTGFRATGTVVEGGTGAALTIAVAGEFADGWFADGTLTWEIGQNAGVSRPVRDDANGVDGRRITLLLAAPFASAVGDTVILTAGCDRRAATCAAKFGNIVNFRGFPTMPGEDWVIAYPRQGDVNDGAPKAWPDAADE